MSKNGIRNRFIIVALFLAFLSYEILSFDFGSGLYIISLVFLCLGSLLKDYVFTGVLNIFTGKNYYLLFYLLLHGIGFFTYHLRLYLGLAVYDHSEDLINRALLYSVIAVLIFLFPMFDLKSYSMIPGRNGFFFFWGYVCLQVFYGA